MENDEIKAITELMEQGIPFNQHLGMVLEHLDKGECRIRIPWKDWLTGDPHRGAVHGGVTSSLIDAAGGTACWTLLEGPDDKLSTVDLRVDYLRKGPTADLICEASVVRMGNRVAVARMEVFSSEQNEGEQPKPFATGQAVYNISKGKR